MDFAPSDRVASPARARPRVHGGARRSRSSARRMEALDAEVAARACRIREILVELRERAKAEGLWNLFLPDDRFGPGLTNWEYGMLCELMGRSGVAPMVFNCAAPDTGNMEILAEHGTEAQQERWLQPLLDGEIRSLLLDDRAGDARAPIPTGLVSRAELDGDEWVINGHKWFTSGYNGASLAIAMVVTDPDAPPHKRASMILVPIDTPGFDGRPAGAGDGPRRGPRPLGGPLRGLPRAGRQPARRARRRLRDRAGPARPGPHPPLHARDRLGRARLRADVPARARPRGVRRAAGREAVRPGLHRQVAHGDRRGAADGAARRLEDGHRGQARRAPGHLDDQGDRGADAPGRARPRDAGARRARHVRRHAAGRACGARAAGCGSPTGPTRSTRW